MTLEIRVESAASGGLKIIKHIPADRPCRLEGRNGIGKSALVRLLVLLSGEQPYRGLPGPWRSLRTLIGPTEVFIDGLKGDYRTAKVRLTPDQWPEDPREDIGEWLGLVTMDDNEVPAHRLFDALTVVHLSGTERLSDTLKQQTGRLAVALNEVLGRLSNLDDQRAELGEMDDQLQFIAPRAAARERARQEALRTELRQVQSTLVSARAVADDLARATALTALVQTGDAAEHQRRLQELRAKLEGARARLAAAQTNHNRAVAALGRGTAAQREVAKRERRLSDIGKLLAGLLTRQEELGARLDALNIPTDVDLLNADQAAILDNGFDVLRKRQRELQVLAARDRRSAAENRLLDDVRVVLDDAVHDGLGDTVIAHVLGNDITVIDLRDGLGFLAEVNDSDLEELAATTSDLAELSALRDLFERRKALQEEAAQVKQQLQSLEPQAAGNDELRQQASAARAALDEANAEVRSHQLEIGAMSRSTLGGADVADIETQIVELLSKHDVGTDQLTAALFEAQTEVMDLQTKDGKLQSELEHLQASATRRRIQRETLRRRSDGDPALSWLRALAERFDPHGAESGADWPDEVWQALADRVAASRASLTQLFNDLLGLEALAAAGSTTRSNRLGRAISSVIESEARLELSAAPIADALFDGGTVLRVSLEDESITWETPSGETRTRPLEAFSSGQQALGFMRARLQQIADQPVENRLVFLDEFGAFISADRRRPLADLLTSDDLQSLAGQVVVVLPLQAEYAAELDQTTGALHEQYKRRATEVAVQGYFTEIFTG